MSKWKKYKLSDIGEIKTGKTPPSKCKEAFSSYGIPFVTPVDMKGQKWIYKTERYITKNGLETVKNYLVPQNSIAVSCIGSDMGKTVLLKKGSITNQQINTVIVNDKHNYEYVYYVLSLMQDYFKSISGGSATPILNKSDFSKVEIKLPSLDIQNRLIEYIRYFDEKIELNTQTNQTLESIAQAIFKSWFVDFDPVRAKAQAISEGKSEREANLSAMAVISGKSTEELNETEFKQLWDIAAAFPSELVENAEFGEVPKGWEKTTIADKRILEIIKPKIYKFEGEKDYIATANVSQNSIVGVLEKITYDTRPSRANMQPIVDSIWFAKMVGEHKAIMIDEKDDFLLNRTILSTGFLGIKPKKYKKCFLYCFINSDFFTQAKNMLATGAVQIALNNGSFSKIEIVLPDDKVLSIFETKMSEIFSSISLKQRENVHLSKIRDELLPKLLKGEI